jgi:hypothetical protein
MRLKISVMTISIFFLISCDNQSYKNSSQQTTNPQPQVPAQPVFQQGVTYRFSNTYQCTAGENKVCVTPAEYEILCRQAKGLSVMGARLLTSFDHVGRELLAGGSVDRIGVEWSDNSKICQAFLTVSGIYQGNSTRRSYSGAVLEFIVNKQNEILGSYTDDPIRTNW